MSDAYAAAAPAWQAVSHAGNAITNSFAAITAIQSENAAVGRRFLESRREDIFAVHNDHRERAC
jgi:cellobiose-specific phosphotransferase system component IIA